MSARDEVVESPREREDAALAGLDAAVGGRSLCSLSRAGVSVPGAKYREGAAAALAEARRAAEAVAVGHDGASASSTALLDVRAQWRAQTGTVGRSGAQWADYLNGGLDALERMLEDSLGRHGSEVAD